MKRIEQNYIIEGLVVNDDGSHHMIKGEGSRQPSMTTEKTVELHAYVLGLRNYVWYANNELQGFEVSHDG